jgi:hypothetical protein
LPKGSPTTIEHGTDPAEALHEALAVHRGPWLLVFDGATHRHTIERFVPTQGNGSILITTVDATAWWPAVQHMPIKTFTSEEARRCFASYAGLTADMEVDPQSLSDIVDRLGLVPLAISMAGMYFRNAAGSPAELVGDYFADLDALEDLTAIPPGFPRTAFAAIEHAVRHLGDGRSGGTSREVRLAQAMLYRASLLGPDLLPLNYLISAMPESGILELGVLPEPVSADAKTRRRYITIFRTQSIAHRVLAIDDDGATSETTDTIEIHPLVHKILRTLFLRQIPREELQFQLAIMMNVLHGWILHMRSRPDYFALDQLVSHADSLIGHIAELGEMPTKSPKHNYLYQYTKIRLQLEVGTCRMSRGDVNGSVNLARLALLDLAKLPRDPIRDAVTLEAVSAGRVAAVSPFPGMRHRQRESPRGLRRPDPPSGRTVAGTDFQGTICHEHVAAAEHGRARLREVPALPADASAHRLPAGGQGGVGLLAGQAAGLVCATTPSPSRFRRHPGPPVVLIELGCTPAAVGEVN